MAEEREARESNGSKKKNKKMIGLIVVAAILIPGIVIQLIWFFGPGRLFQKNAISDYFRAVSNEDVDLLKEVCYPRKWQKHYKPNGQNLDLDSVIEDSFLYQSGAKFSNVKIISERKLPADTVKDFRRGIQDLYNVDVSVSAVSRVTFKVTIEFTDGSNPSRTSGEMTRYLYKVNGKWYFLSDTLLLVHLDLD